MTTNTQFSKCFITINNNTVEDEKLIEENMSKFSYIAIGKHVGEKSKLPHIHVIIQLKKRLRFTGLKKIFPRGDIETLKGTWQQAYDYLNKENDTWSEGDLPIDQGIAGGQAHKEKWDLVKQLAKEDRVEEIESKYYIQYYTTLQRIASDNKPVPTELDWIDPPNEWHWGPSGVGKSRQVRAENNDIYLKMCNKWWDNYRGEAVVLIEDFDKSHAVLCHHLKIWADRYGFRAERKNGTVVIRPQKIIITSNWAPDSIWVAQEDRLPIERRFRIIEH